MISFQFGVEQHAPCNVIGMTEVFHWSVIDGVIVGSPCDTPPAGTRRGRECAASD